MRCRVIGFPGYMVGDDGSVWSNRVSADGSWRKMNPSPNASGHMTIALRRDGKTHRRYVHTLVLDAFMGLCPEGCEARHFPDRDPANNSLSNLSWGTRRENMLDKTTHGTMLRGDTHGSTKATRKLSKIVRDEYSTGAFSQRSLAKRHGVAQMTVNRIVRNQIGV